MKAIVTGISGQDGFFMAQRLQADGVEVLGLTSDRKKAADALVAGESLPVELLEFDFENPGEIDRVLEDYRPDYFFNFAANYMLRIVPH